MKIVFLAVPGSGKTTIMNLVRQRMPDVAIVNYGDVMFEIARRRYGIEHRDEMRRKLPIEEYRRVQEEAAEQIAAMKGDVIVDTHASIKIGGGYYPGLPDRVVSRLRPDVILVVEYDPKEVVARRRKDPTRFRDVESEEEIERHQMANRYFAFAAANAGESAVHVIDLRGRPQTRDYEHAEIVADYIVGLISRGRSASSASPSGR